MLKKEITLKAIFNKYDEQTKKLSMLFLDTEIEPFTKNFLTKYYSESQHNPINRNEFYVKFDMKKSICFLDKGNQVIVPVQDMLDKVVSITVLIKHYNFTNAKGNKIIGWNIHLLVMKPV